MCTERRSDIDKVLDNDLCYDDLDSEEDKALVRQAWEKRAQQRLAQLDFEAEFTAQGRPWTEIDERGNPVRREPPGVGPSR